jgi:hypothetical protein
MAIPESYGTFSHLCASVAHESASATPSVRYRSFGLAAAHSPNAPVDVAPGVTLACEHRDLRHRIERAGVDLPHLGDHDRRALVARQQPGELGRPHAALVINRHELDASASQAQHPQRGENGGVGPGAH